MDGTTFEKMTIRNFLSFGDTPQTVWLDGRRITTIMGVNLDSESQESRNGTGKSAILDALAYCLYGKSLRGIPNAGLVRTGMEKRQQTIVTLEFHVGDQHYRIERGEKPSLLRLFQKPVTDTRGWNHEEGGKLIFDITRPSKPATTDHIKTVIGMEFVAFQYLVANSSENDPFPKLPEADRKELMERLLGFRQMTERGEKLKEKRRDLNKEVIREESTLEANKRANERVQYQLDQLLQKQRQWNEDREKNLEELVTTLEVLQQTDVAEQIATLEKIEEAQEQSAMIAREEANARAMLNQIMQQMRTLKNVVDNTTMREQEETEALKKMLHAECPTCRQAWKPAKEVIAQKREMIAELVQQKQEGLEEYEKFNQQMIEHDEIINELRGLKNDIPDIDGLRRDLTFSSIDEAREASTLIQQVQQEIERIDGEKNPHTETIETMSKDALVDIDDSELQRLRKYVRHHDVLIDLLVSKESYIRKSVLNRWLPRLNNRIHHYLTYMEFPYNVKVDNELQMQIGDGETVYGWGNLSRGQRQRVTVALNFAFQDLYRSIHSPSNLLVVDELIDNGMCTVGARQVVELLEQMVKQQNKRILLITHRQDISDNIQDTIMVEFRDRISRIRQEDDEDLPDLEDDF